jgi:hypothetical protein
MPCVHVSLSLTHVIRVEISIQGLMFSTFKAYMRVRKRTRQWGKVIGDKMTETK